jgi:hypothetical protein
MAVQAGRLRGCSPHATMQALRVEYEQTRRCLSKFLSGRIPLDA